MFRNQKQAYSKLISIIKPYSEYKIVVLSGDAGIGKSFVVQELINAVADKYNKKICYIKGDQFMQHRDYYCIKQALEVVNYTYEKKMETVEIVADETRKRYPFNSLLVSLATHTLWNQEKKQKKKGYKLNDDELNIINRLNYYFDKKPALIVCDNFQYFDSKTLELIYMILTSKETVFNYLTNCQYLFINTEHTTEVSSIAKKICSFDGTKTIRMSPIIVEDMDDILKKFGCKQNIDKEIIQILFKLSEGHLEVIKQVALQINNTEDEFKFNNEITSVNNFLDELISQKLGSLGASGEQVSQLLEYASLIGKTFSNEELSRIVDLNMQEFVSAIKKSNDLSLIFSQKKYSIFSHDIIQLLFRKKAEDKSIAYYNKIGNCLKELMPADYVQRIEVATNSGDLNSAAIYSVLFLAKKNYDKSFLDKNISDLFSLNPSIKLFFNKISDAFEKYTKQKYQQTINILNCIEDFYPVELLAERDLMKSITYTKILDENYREKAIQCLEEYTLEKLNNEGDLYLRIQLARISSYTHAGQIEYAKKCEKEIMQYLQSRVSYDDNALTTINILHRKSNAIKQCIYAEKYIKESVDYFAPLPGQTAPLDPIQYLMSLGNHAGILLECGRFADACDEIIKAQKLIAEHSNIDFPRIQIVDNNCLIGTYLYDSNMKHHVLEKYKTLVDLNDNADNYFIVSNYGALLSVNGYTKEAYELLQKQQRVLKKHKEPFYEVCTNNNLLVLELFNKEYESAQERLNMLQKCVDGIIDESYYRKKYELFQKVINEKYEISFEKIDTFLFDMCESFQEAWAYWGRSFDYTALYYWSDM